MTSFNLIATGMAMGVVHVLTGPDHLSALATVSANVGQGRAFWYGVRWGVGHSIGLVLVGSILIIISNANYDGEETIEMPAVASKILESIVGLFMIGLGSYGLYSVCKKRREEDELEQQMKQSEFLLDDGFALTELIQSTSSSPISPKKQEISSTSIKSTSKPLSSSSKTLSGTNLIPQRSIATATTPLRMERGYVKKSVSLIDLPTEGEIITKRGSFTIVHDKYCPPSCCPSFSCISLPSLAAQDATTNTTTNPSIQTDNRQHSNHHSHDNRNAIAILIGIVHGIAGPGGVLGVIPAVQLHNASLAFVYLGTFCLTSTIVMGCFAATYGIISDMISHNHRNISFRIEVFSASLCIIVGLLWVILSAIGKLEDIFP